MWIIELAWAVIRCYSHCLWFTVITLWSQDHRAVAITVGDGYDDYEIVFVGCTCGRVHLNLIPDDEEGQVVWEE